MSHRVKFLDKHCEEGSSDLTCLFVACWLFYVFKSVLRPLVVDCSTWACLNWLLLSPFKIERVEWRRTSLPTRGKVDFIMHNDDRTNFVCWVVPWHNMYNFIWSTAWFLDHRISKPWNFPVVGAALTKWSVVRTFNLSTVVEASCGELKTKCSRTCSKPSCSG